ICQKLRRKAGCHRFRRRSRRRIDRRSYDFRSRRSGVALAGSRGDTPSALCLPFRHHQRLRRGSSPPSRESRDPRMNVTANPAAPPVKLKRALTLWNLIIIGIVIIQPIAPMGIYGVINNNAGGHVVTTILIAMVAMLFTAISYGKMARAYPSAG